MFVVARPRLKRGEDMPKPGSIDLVKERHWRGIIRDWQESGLSMSAYCLMEKIKLGQLSTWFKKIKARDHARKSSASSAQSAASARSAPQSENSASSKTGSMGFAEVHVTDPVPAVQSVLAPVLDVVLNCGINLRLRDNCSMAFLVKVVDSLEGRDV